MFNRNLIDLNTYQPNNEANLSQSTIVDAIEKCCRSVAPAWPLSHQVASNPIQGLETLPFINALEQAFSKLYDPSMLNELTQINRITIKWCQAFFDHGQACFAMPHRHNGFFRAIKAMLIYDNQAHDNNTEQKDWLTQIPDDPELALINCIKKLKLGVNEMEIWLNFLVYSLPGWAAYAKYLDAWDNAQNTLSGTTKMVEYLAIRAIIFCLTIKESEQIVKRLQILNQPNTSKSLIDKITKNENQYKLSLLGTLVQKNTQNKPAKRTTDIQMLFCIDVRSEPMRRLLEHDNQIETFGCAGFFGLPISVSHCDKNSSLSHCPALLKPKHNIKIKTKKSLSNWLKSLYSGTKYNIYTPFALAEFLGPFCGILMTFKNFFYSFGSSHLEQKNQTVTENDLSTLDLDSKTQYAKQLLASINLTQNFASVVVLCGHSSTTTNNPYASSLQCGACGGQSGYYNANSMVSILNDQKVRNELIPFGITIPKNTVFITGIHNTTANMINFDLPEELTHQQNTALEKVSRTLMETSQSSHIKKCNNWSEVRPEWGLAKNAAFIIAPRELTQQKDLEGRAFLHDYHWENDIDGKILESIMTAPMIVTQWINTQYLFSSLDNVAFGAGSKITGNISGKAIMMQGNASDFMHGLSLQSIKGADDESYHEPIRLMVCIQAPKQRIFSIVRNHAQILQLVKNQWISLICLDPEEQLITILDSNLTWRCHEEIQL